MGPRRSYRVILIASNEINIPPGIVSVTAWVCQLNKVKCKLGFNFEVCGSGNTPISLGMVDMTNVYPAATLLLAFTANQFFF